MPPARRRGVTARLYTSAGGWQLPTIDADGLSAHALLRFGDVEYSAVSTQAAPSDPPVVVFESGADDGSAPPDTAHGLSGLIGMLASHSALPDPNQHLTPFMTAESTAFATLVATRFAPARLYEFYLKPANYDDVYHNALSKTDSFPLNRVIPFLSRRRFRLRFDASGKSVVETYFDAGITLAALATRLGDRAKYFYGDKPSVLDAIVFGQLASVMFCPLPDPQLKSMLVAHPNLVQFVLRVKNEFFPRDKATGWGADLDADAVAEMRREGAARRAAEQRRTEASERARRDQERADRASAGADDHKNHPEDEDAIRQRYNWYFIYGTAAAFAAHLLFGSEIELEVG